MTSSDTIVAIATAPGRGAVGIVRVSGALVPRLAEAVLGKLPAARRAEFTDFRDAKGQSLDRGLAVYFPAPASFTGEHVLELQGHGGVVVLDLLVRRLLELGCRSARPGEFSERAFLNGKMDVAQAEAVADLIDAGSAAAARAAVRSLQGEFSARVHELQALLTDLRVHVEARIDFPDERLALLQDGVFAPRLQRLFAAFEALRAAAYRGALLRDGLTVVIAGEPNAGKSSLLNALVGDEVAIVTDAAGTTRDVLRHRLHEDGIPLHLIDTAGLRSAADAIEAEGIRRARLEIARADRVLYLIDAAAAPAAAPATAAELQRIVPQVPVTVVFNKIDLAGLPARVDAEASPPRIFLSAKTGDGIGLLRAHLQTSAGEFPAEGDALAARRRHIDALGRARIHLEDAAAALGSSEAVELFAEDLRFAQQALGEITGEFTSDDLLGKIFASFCIGK